MAFKIDNVRPNARAQKTLSEIDALVDYRKSKPERIALFPDQFDYVKRSCLLAVKRSFRASLKASKGGERLKPGELQNELESYGFSSMQSAKRLSYKGIELYDKAETGDVPELFEGTNAALDGLGIKSN